jgi:transglutaminase-like putative cysteine protease
VQAIPFGLAFKLSAYLLVVDGFAALVLADALSPVAAGGVGAAIAATWWADRLRRHLRPRLVTGVGVALFVFLVVDTALLAESFFDGVIHLLVLLLLYKLATWGTARDAIQVGVLSFFLLVAASAVTISPGFLAIFVAFLVVGTWAFTLLHLRQEAERFSPAAGRTLETARIVTPGFIAISLVLSLVALALTTAIFFFLPRVGRAFLPLQARGAGMATGFADRVELGAFGTIQADTTAVMRVHLPDHREGAPPPEGLRWRGLAFDRFDGTAWTAAARWRRPLPRRLEGTFVLRRPDPARPLVRQEVDLEPLGTDVLFAAPGVQAVSGPMASLQVDEAGAVLLPQRPVVRLHYVAYSQPPQGGTGRTGAPEAALPAALAERYLQLPPLPARVAALARELAAGARGPLEKAQRFEAALRQRYRYSLSLQRDRRLGPVEDFLFQQRTGHCEYFAASLAVMLRLEGVPARVVNGFQPGEWNEFGRYFTVRQRDAHAWVEAFIPGAGWLTFDPSPRAEFEAGQGYGAGPLMRYLDFLRTRWTRYVVDYSLRDQMQAALFLRQQTARLRQGVGFALTRRVGLPAGAWRWIAAAAVLAATAVFLLGRRAGGPAEGAGRRRGSDVRFHARLRRALARRGFVPAPGETPLELARRAADGAGPPLAPAEEITRLYYRVRFGAEPLAPAEAARVEALLATLERPERKRLEA